MWEGIVFFFFFFFSPKGCLVVSRSLDMGERASVVYLRACHLQEVRRNQKTEAGYVPLVYKV